jgi:hypothetical protein
MLRRLAELLAGLAAPAGGAAPPPGPPGAGGAGEPHVDATPTVHDVRGFRVVVENTRPDIRTEDVLRRLDEALALAERHQP